MVQRRWDFGSWRIRPSAESWLQQSDQVLHEGRQSPLQPGYATAGIYDPDDDSDLENTIQAQHKGKNRGNSWCCFGNTECEQMFGDHAFTWKRPNAPPVAKVYWWYSFPSFPIFAPVLPDNAFHLIEFLHCKLLVISSKDLVFLSQRWHNDCCLLHTLVSLLSWDVSTEDVLLGSGILDLNLRKIYFAFSAQTVDGIDLGSQQPSIVRGDWLSHLHTVGDQDCRSSAVSLSTRNSANPPRRNGRPAAAPAIKAQAQRRSTLFQHSQGMRCFIKFGWNIQSVNKRNSFWQNKARTRNEEITRTRAKPQCERENAKWKSLTTVASTWLQREEMKSLLRCKLKRGLYLGISLCGGLSLRPIPFTFSPHW